MMHKCAMQEQFGTAATLFLEVPCQDMGGIFLVFVFISPGDGRDTAHSYRPPHSYIFAINEYFDVPQLSRLHIAVARVRSHIRSRRLCNGRSDFLRVLLFCFAKPYSTQLLYADLCSGIGTVGSLAAEVPRAFTRHYELKNIIYQSHPTPRNGFYSSSIGE